MKFKTRVFTVISIIYLLVFPLHANAGQQDAELVNWNSEQGIQRLFESQYKVDFFQLANHFQTQPNGILCGPTSASIVLNAMRLGKKGEQLPFTKFDKVDGKYIPPGFDPRINMYLPDNFVGPLTDKVKTRAQIFGEPIDGKPDFGLQIRQLHGMFIAHGAGSSLRVVNDELSLDNMRSDMISNLQTKDDYVVVNYARKLLGQDGPGHISPLGAYHKNSDSFLILDVTSYEHNWVWVPAASLYKAMKSFDTIENRGYVLIEDS